MRLEASKREQYRNVHYSTEIWDDREQIQSNPTGLFNKNEIYSYYICVKMNFEDDPTLKMFKISFYWMILSSISNAILEDS